MLGGTRDLEDDDDISIEQILVDLMDGEKNLDLKTHIFSPKDLAGLYTLRKYFKEEGITGLADVIKNHIKKYLRYMISLNRESRKEIISAVTEIKKKMTMSFSERITTNQAKQ